MGDEAEEDTLISTNIYLRETERVITKFDAFFKVRENIIFDELDLTAVVREKASC